MLNCTISKDGRFNSTDIFCNFMCDLSEICRNNYSAISELKKPDKKRVILIGHPSDSLALLRQYVKSLGHSILTETIEYEEVMRFSRRLSPKDLIIVTGNQFFEIIKNIHLSMPYIDIVIVSDGEDRQSIKNAYHAGSKKFITTPVSIEKIRKMFYKI